MDDKTRRAYRDVAPPGSAAAGRPPCRRACAGSGHCRREHRKGVRTFRLTPTPPNRWRVDAAMRCGVLSGGAVLRSSGAMRLRVQRRSGRRGDQGFETARMASCNRNLTMQLQRVLPGSLLQYGVAERRPQPASSCLSDILHRTRPAIARSVSSMALSARAATPSRVLQSRLDNMIIGPVKSDIATTAARSPTRGRTAPYRFRTGQSRDSL